MKSRLIAALCFTLTIMTAGCVDCTHADSPQGDVPFGTEVCSPDRKLYARELEPRDQGHFGLHDKSTGRLIKKIRVNHHPAGYPNPLKGLAWSPDGRHLAAMYHYDGRGHISIMSVETGEEVKSITIPKYYHSMRFQSEKVITAGRDTYRVE